MPFRCIRRVGLHRTQLAGSLYSVNVCMHVHICRIYHTIESYANRQQTGRRQLRLGIDTVASHDTKLTGRQKLIAFF